jgi:hypothetical protein
MARRLQDRLLRGFIVSVAWCTVACSSPQRRFALAAIDGHRLPVSDSVNFGGHWRVVNRVTAGTLTFVRADSVRIEQTNRDMMTASWPCSALRITPSGGSGGLTAVASTDTVTAGCEALRTRQDTTWLAIERDGTEFVLRQTRAPAMAGRQFRGRERGDTLFVDEVQLGRAASSRTLTYVRVRDPRPNGR